MIDRRCKLTALQVTQLQKLYKMRVPSSHIAEHFHVSTNTVRHHTGQGHMIKLTVPEVLEAIAA